MYLEHLQIERFRSLDHVELHLSPGLNVFYGPNGAGKTSILEAVSFLATGRSFLTPRYTHLIQQGRSDVLVSGRKSGAGLVQLGIQRTLAGQTQARIDGEAVTGLSRLARQLPYLVVGAEGLAWMVGSPQRRRSLLDWGVFHVLAEDTAVFQRYRKALEQRNKALKNDKITRAEVATWDQVLSESGERIIQLRHQYFNALHSCLKRMFGTFEDLPVIEWSYKPGYSVDKGDLFAALERGFERDRMLGSTQSGPHRGDLLIQCRGVPAAEGLSRGQQKVLVAMLVLAQQELLLAHQSQQVVLLVDDLAAELDDQRQRELLDRMATTGSQWLLSAVGHQRGEGLLVDRFEGLIKNAGDVRMFHVKQGAVAMSE